MTNAHKQIMQRIDIYETGRKAGLELVRKIMEDLETESSKNPNKMMTYEVIWNKLKQRLGGLE